MILQIIFSVVWLMVSYVFWSERKLEQLEIEKGKFENPFLDGLHRYGHIFPLKHFTDDDDELTKKGEVMKQRLIDSGLNKYFTVRSYMAMTILFLVVSLLLGMFFVYITQYSARGAELILGIEIDIVEGMSLKQGTITMMFFLLIALFPSLYLKNKARKVVATSAKELPMLQMFVILMLRSEKTISEILYALSKLNSSHREVFMKGYRIYVRSPNEGMEYLRNHFQGSRFADMFDLLEDVSEYAREETIVIMESSMKGLVDETNDIRRKNDLTQLVYSQASMIAPFVALILLGVAPLVNMAIELFSNAMEL